MTRLKFKSIVYLLLLVFVISQVFGGVVLDATAQDAAPTIPKPPYVEPEPVKQDVKPGGLLLQGDAVDASSESTLILSSGESKIHGLIYYDGYLWASTRTKPAKVIKINPASTPMAVVNSVTLATNRNDAEDIVAANGYIWTVASATDTSGLAYLVRIDPATMGLQETPLFIDNQNYMIWAVSLKYAHGKLWVGGNDTIAEFDITTPGSPTFALHDYSALIDEEFVWATALTSDATHLWAIFGQGIYGGDLTGSTIVRIDPANPASYVETDISEIFPDDMFYMDSHLYTSSEVTGQPSYAYKVPNTLTPYTTQLAYSNGISYGVFFNPLDPYSFWGAFTSSPGKLIKFDLNLTNLWELNLPTTPSNFDDPSEIVFDGNGNMYVSTFADPARLVRYSAPDAVTVSISKSGNNAVLSWNNTDALVDHFEIWRSTYPYFTPQGTTPYATVTADVGTNTYTDVGALGDINNNYFYVVRAFNDFGLLSPISNRVGEIGYPLNNAGNKYTLIAIPFSGAVSDASDLASYIGNVNVILKWNPTVNSFRFFVPPSSGDDFQIARGDAIYVNVSSASASLVSFVGEVAALQHTLVPGKYNFISMPLQRSELTTASATASDITNVLVMLSWNEVIQNYRFFVPPSSGDNFSLRVGSPFVINLGLAGPTVWP